MNALDQPRRKGGYPLGALFVVTAACAVLSGILAPVTRSLFYGSVDGWAILASVIITLILGSMTGLCVGLYHYRRIYGAAIGLVFGALLGAISGLLAFSSPDDFPALIIASIGGSAILICVGAAYRITLKPAPAPRESKGLDQPSDQEVIEAELVDD